MQSIDALPARFFFFLDIATISTITITRETLSSAVHYMHIASALCNASGASMYRSSVGLCMVPDGSRGVIRFNISRFLPAPEARKISRIVLHPPCLWGYFEQSISV